MSKSKKITNVDNHENETEGPIYGNCILDVIDNTITDNTKITTEMSTQDLLEEINTLKAFNFKSETEPEPELAKAFYELMEVITVTKVEMAKLMGLKTVTFAYKLKNRTFTKEEIICLLDGLKGSTNS